MRVLPAYLWPPLSWIEVAKESRGFAVAYPPLLPKGSYYARYWLPEGHWLTVPLVHATKKTPFQATWPPDKPWRLYHWKVLLTLYGKAPFFYEWKPFLEYLYLEAPFTTLYEVTNTVLQELARLYGWKATWVKDLMPEPMVFARQEASILPHLLRVGL
ncbi:MAG: WbqC family protein [Bacteroidia bacterium]|nr:WbqC family protein [Bacteroidia bacterium]GIV23213.1 MAG: hypothetical protein KatS3mg025_0872 [Bacteroidia bacterium]